MKYPRIKKLPLPLLIPDVGIDEKGLLKVLTDDANTLVYHKVRSGKVAGECVWLASAYDDLDTEFRGRAMELNPDYDWQIGVDKRGNLLLVPTLKKDKE